MSKNSYKDISRVVGDLSGLFLCSEREALNWIFAVNNGIREWIGNHNKQYWEVVRFVSERRGVLGKPKRDGSVCLTRNDFATVLVRLCPDALKERDTVRALRASMEQYQYVSDLAKFDTLHEGYYAYGHVKDVENLLDNVPLADRSEEKRKPTLVDRMDEFLRRDIDEQTDRFPQSTVRIRPQYQKGSITPAISVETYLNRQFFEKHQPSNIQAYEFIDGKLNREKLYELIGRYNPWRNVKLFIVSTHGLTSQIRSLALKNEIGYMLIDPNKEITSDCYILPRSIEDNTKQRHDLEVLEGKHPMTTPLLIIDNGRVTSSLADVLNSYDVVVKSSRLMDIPYLQDEEIEELANDLTREDVEQKIRHLRSYPMMSFDLSLDPFAYAGRRGLEYANEGMTDNFQLGRLEVKNNRVILNRKGLGNYQRYRFTMAHELGHHILHAKLFKEQGVVSVGETESTLSFGESNSQRMEYQANKFASCLLMPKNLVLNLYVVLFNIHVTNKYGTSIRALYYNPSQPETYDSYNNIVGGMAKVLDVSKQAMQIRLSTLRLLKTGS